jgi:thiamine-phosphate pyrophosphorylase
VLFWCFCAFLFLRYLGGRNMKVSAQQLQLYAVTDRAWLHGRTLESQVAAAIAGGATFVQLREKALDPSDILAEAKVIGALCRAHHVPFVINDSVEICLACGADGVHVGQDDMAATSARALLGPDKILGVSAHNVAEALAAQQAGADYLGCGAAFVTGTKTDAKPIKRETLQAVTAAVSIPVIAIGGISYDNLLQLKGCGLAGIAVVSAIFAQEDVQAATAALKVRTQQMLKA